MWLARVDSRNGVSRADIRGKGIESGGSRESCIPGVSDQGFSAYGRYSLYELLCENSPRWKPIVPEIHRARSSPFRVQPPSDGMEVWTVSRPHEEKGVVRVVSKRPGEAILTSSGRVSPRCSDATGSSRVFLTALKGNTTGETTTDSVHTVLGCQSTLPLAHSGACHPAALRPPAPYKRLGDG